jgi:glucose/arabinose dehydrogenase
MHRARLLAAIALLSGCRHSATTTAGGCDASIKVPKGFCAAVVAEGLGRAQGIVVRSNGDLFVARAASRRDSGGISSIRQQTVQEFWTGPVRSLALASDSTLYAATAHEILRFRFKGDSLLPRKTVDTIVAGLPSSGDAANTIALNGDAILVSIPAQRVGCDRKQPCPDLAVSAGIWKFDTGRKNQALKDGSRIATGLRAATAFAVNPRDTTVYAVTHGPDSLHERFPQIDPIVAATHPGDEMIRVASIHADYGWPYCYWDVIAATRVRSPEYGGDGRNASGCDRLIRPLMSFPAHWEPVAMAFANGKLGGDYKDGAFVAFHGSSHRDPLPEEGYLVAWVPFKDGIPLMDFQTFADGFAGASATPTGARARPAGLAQAADGSLYVSDDKGGRIWKISHGK